MTEKILYVDDEKDVELLISQKFRKEIKSKKYEFLFAYNGKEALDLLTANPDITMILSDINMPVMDGLTLLSRLNELNNPALKTVIVSAYGDMDNIRIAMNRGAFDFITKPINFEDLEITINKTIHEALYLRKSIRDQKKLVILESDLNIARNIQQSILPKVFPPFPDIKEFDLYASMNAARSVGGDFYDFFLIDNDRLAFVIGDVCDKGVPAAIFMAVSRTLIRANGIKGYSAEECLFHVNNLLCQESVDCMFVTVFYAIINFRTGVVNYSNGGHNPPYIIRSNGEVEEIPTTGNLVLGINENHVYKSNNFELQPGDSIYLYTDGVTEAMNPERKVYGEPRLEKLLATLNGSGPKEVIDEIVRDVATYTEGAPQSDDITMLSFKYFGSE